MDAHQESVSGYTRCNQLEVLREFTLEVREVAKTTSDYEDYTFDVCVHGVLDKLPLLLFQELEQNVRISNELTSTISSSMAAFSEYGSYLLIEVVESENGCETGFSSFFWSAELSATLGLFLLDDIVCL